LSKKIYGAWAKSSPGSPEVMQKATEEHSKWNIGFNEICEKYSIPKLTFHGHLKGKVKRGLNSSKALDVREMALDPKVKDVLVKHTLYLEECVFGLTISDTRRLALHIAETSFRLCSLCSQSPL
jgi:hypothetical protein